MQPQPRATLPTRLVPGDLPAGPAPLHTLARTRELSSTGRPSPWRPAPFPISCALALPPAPSSSSRREPAPESSRPCRNQLQPHNPSPGDPGTTPAPALPPASLLCVGPAGSHAGGPGSSPRSLGLGLPIHVLLNHVKKMRRSWEGLLRTGRLCAGNCSAAVSPPRPRGAAKLGLQTPSPEPGAGSPRRAGAGPARGRGSLRRRGETSRPPPARPPHPQAREGAQRTRVLSPHRAAGRDLRQALVAPARLIFRSEHTRAGPTARPVSMHSAWDAEACGLAP